MARVAPCLSIASDTAPAAARGTRGRSPHSSQTETAVAVATPITPALETIADGEPACWRRSAVAPSEPNAIARPPPSTATTGCAAQRVVTTAAAAAGNATLV